MKELCLPLALLSSFGLFLVALFTLRTDGLHTVDSELLSRASAHDDGVVHSLAEALRLLGELLPQIVLVAGAAAIGWRRGLVDRAIAVVVLVLGANLTTQFLKDLIVDDRFAPVAIRLYGINEHTFPSGHTTTMTAMTFAWLIVVPARLRLPVAAIGAIATILVGGAMVVLHRHWPSDVIGGMLVGCIWGFAAIAALEALEDRAGAPPSHRS